MSRRAPPTVKDTAAYSDLRWPNNLPRVQGGFREVEVVDCFITSCADLGSVLGSAVSHFKTTRERRGLEVANTTPTCRHGLEWSPAVTPWRGSWEGSHALFAKTLSRETFSKLMRLPVSLWNLLHMSLYMQFICLRINAAHPFSNAALIRTWVTLKIFMLCDDKSCQLLRWDTDGRGLGWKWIAVWPLLIRFLSRTAAKICTFLSYDISKRSVLLSISLKIVLFSRFIYPVSVSRTKFRALLIFAALS